MGMRGTDPPMCRKHGGNLPGVQAKAKRNLAVAPIQKEMLGYGKPVGDGDPAEFLMGEIRRTQGHVIWLEERVQMLSQAEMIWNETKFERKDVSTGEESSYDVQTQEAVMSVWIALYHKERQHLVNTIKIALSLGLEERRVRLQEETVTQLNAAITGILRALGKDPNDPDVRQVVRSQLLALDPA